MLKTLAYSSKNEKPKPSTAGAAGEHLGVFFPSVEEACHPHALTQLRLARSHARTTRTRNETETDFPIGVDKSIISPQSPIYIYIYIYMHTYIEGEGDREYMKIDELHPSMESDIYWFLA